MDKNVTKKRKKNGRAAAKRRHLRAGVMTLLFVLGVGLLAGMAVFNRNVKPNRDMQWYVREGAVQIAAPALGEGFQAERDSEFRLPEEGMRAQPQPAEPGEDADEVADDDAGTPLVAAAVGDAQAAAGAFLADIAATDAAADTADAMDAADDMDAADEMDAAEGADTGDIADDMDADADAPGAEPEEDTPVGPVTLTITAAGDCTFSGEVGSKSNVRFLEYVEKYGYEYFLRGVRSIFEADDLTIVNLEGPLTTSEKKHAHGYVFKADPACAEILTSSSVELCNVANNHSLDYGTAGLKQTAEVLDGAGVGYCGYTAVYEKTIKGVRVCALGFTKWNHSDEKIVEAVTAARANCDLLIVNVHWGVEGQYTNNTQQTVTGHAIIDAGADLVIGTHPHVIQGIEKYKGKYIVYSLGNFCFAGNANPEDKRCLIFQQSFGFVPGMGIVQAGIADEGINLIPCMISSVTQKNDFQPTVLPAEQGAAVLKQVINHSTNFNVKKTLWMKDNYLLENGLIKSRNGQSGQADEGEADTAGLDLDADAGELADDAPEPDDDVDTDAAAAAFGMDIEAEDEPFFGGGTEKT